MILIGTDDGIYRWFEGCGWPIFHSLQGRSLVDVSSPGGGILAALDRSGAVYESVNNGQDWRTIPLPAGLVTSTPTALALWGSPGAIVLATRPLGLLSRPVGAAIPRPEPKPSTNPKSGSILVERARSAAAKGTALLPSRKKPTSEVDRETAGWSRLNVPNVAGAADPAIRAMALATGPARPWLVAVRGAGLWRSTDSAASWKQCPGLPAEVNAVRVTPKRPGALFAATSNGVWVSNDEGETWEERSAGLEDTRYLSTLDVKPDAPDTLLAAAAPREPGAAETAPRGGLDFSLLESTNGGKSWSRVVRRGIPETFAHDAITDVRYDPAAPENIVVALASGEIWLSRNAGAYFSPLARQIEAARVLCATV